MVKISVVIPVYNADNFLYESLSSVLNQTFGDIELICVNDGSKDRSLRILEKFAKEDNRIRIIDQENAGSGVARNKALDVAVGDYIFFFNPEDYILPDAIGRVYNNAVNNDSDIALFKVAKFRDDGSVDYSRPCFDFEHTFDNDVDFENFIFNINEAKKYVLNSNFSPWTKLYKREFLDAYDDFRFTKNTFDALFHIKSMLRASKISYVPDYLYFYRFSNPNSVNNTSTNAMFMDIIDMVEKFLKDKNYWGEFIREFYLFKVDQIFHPILSINSEDYYQRARKELLKVREDMKKYDMSDNLLSEWHLMHYDFISDSNTLEEYRLNTEIQKIKNEIINLKNDNKNITNQKKKLQRQNKNLLNSHSWKLTKPLRKLKKYN